MLFIVAIILIIITYLYIRKRFSYWHKKKISYITPTIPFGNITGIGRIHITHIIKRIYDSCRYKDVLVGIYTFTQPAVVILDPQLVMNIMVRDFNFFHERGVYYNEVDDPLSANLFTLEGHKWRNMHNILSHSFTNDNLKMYFKYILQISNDIQTHLEQEIVMNNIIDVRDLSSRYVIDIFGPMALGMDSKNLQNSKSELMLKMDKLCQPSGCRTFRKYFYSLFRRHARLLGLRVYTSELSKYIIKNVEKSMKERITNQITKDDFMNYFINLYHTGEGEGLTSISQVAAQAFSFVTSSFQTSSITMAFCLYELARNSAIQDRVRAEITHNKKEDEELTYENLNKYKYLDNVISETLRLYPVFGNIQRCTDRNYEVDDTNYIIEKGTIVNIPVYAMHMDPKYFPEPEKFIPDRFCDENRVNIIPYTYLPFGDGPRICLGREFGLVIIKLGLINILEMYRVTHCNESASNSLDIEPNSDVPILKEGFRLKIDKL